MFKRFVQFAAVGLLPLLLVGQASASIVSGSVTGTTANTAGSTFVVLGSGATTVGGNADFLGKNVYGLNEKQGVTVGAGGQAVQGGTIAAGTRVDSQLIFANLQNTGAVSAVIKFASKVLGVIVQSNPNPDTLTPSNAVYGRGNVTYNGSAANNWGMETGYVFAPFTEGVSISGANEITFTAAGVNVDSVRVLTAENVPEPGSMAILGFATVAFVGAARFRRRKGATAE